LPYRLGENIEYEEVVVQALREETLPAGIVAIKNVEPSKHPD
jgi:hypothetical protein